MTHTLTLDACVESFIVDDVFSPEVMTRALVPGVAAPTDGPSAAVAAVMRIGLAGAEMLFIERSSKKGDPWSGQMAFPGGRTAALDEHSLATAVRETKEELDLDLANLRPLGRLSDLEGGPRGTRQRLRVTPHLFGSTEIDLLSLPTTKSLQLYGFLLLICRMKHDISNTHILRWVLICGLVSQSKGSGSFGD